MRIIQLIKILMHSSVALAITAATAFTDTFDLAGKEIIIPAPDGFVRVTNEMGVVYRFIVQMTDPMNKTLACYIAESEIPTAMADEESSLERIFVLKASNDIGMLIAGKNEFDELKLVFKRENNKTLDKMLVELPNVMKQISMDVSGEFDIEYSREISRLAPMKAHYEAGNAMAFSVFIDYRETIDSEIINTTRAATFTFLNPAGRVIYLNAYGPRGDLEWTRNASKEWAERIIQSNVPPHAGFSKSTGSDWDEILGRCFLVIAFLAFIELLKGRSSMFRKLKK